MSIKYLSRSQILILAILAMLLTVTPFLSPSLRSTYLYLVANFLIVVVGVDAGFLAVFPRAAEGEKQSPAAARESAVEGKEDGEKEAVASYAATLEWKEKPVGRMGNEGLDKMRKCTSEPNLFFTGTGAAESEKEDDDGEGDLAGGQKGRELSAKAEAFIGNFYEQLRMQRGFLEEES